MEEKGSSLPIYVKIQNPDTITNNSNFIIEGTMIPKPLERTFKDFILLREKLIERWPGIVIPNLSLKENLDIRVNMLNSFCSKLYQIKYLFDSEEVKIFLKESNDYNKSLNSLEKKNYDSILKKYSGIFIAYDDNFDAQYEKVEQDKFYKNLTDNFNNLGQLKNLIYTTREKYKLNHNYFNIIENIFSLYETDLLKNYSNNDDSKLIFLNKNNSQLENNIKIYEEKTKNPFDNLYYSITDDYLNTLSLIEGIDSINNLQNEYDKKAKIFTEKNSEVIDLQAGKSSLKTIFSFKSRETDINNAINEKDKIEKELNYLKNIINVCIFNMQTEIINFKHKSIESYYNELKILEEELENNLKIENNIWENILEDNNIKSIKDD
jgi:hypothetical protein